MRGHTRKRGKKWAVVVDIGRDENDNRRQRWHSGFDTKREAEAALADILGEVKRGEYVEPSKLSMRGFLTDWLAGMKARVRPTTWHSYQLAVERYIIPHIGSTRIQALAAPQLNRLYADLQEHGGKGGRPVSSTTARFTHGVLRRALEDAVKQKLVPRNVTTDAAAPSKRAVEMKTWAPEELRHFLDRAKGHRLYPALLLAATTGMRRGEVCGLRWRDLDLDSASLSVTQTIVLVNGKPDYSAPKTKKGKRSIALDQMTVAALRSHRARQLEERIVFEGTWPDHDLVFTQEDGLAIVPDHLSYLFEEISKAAELPRIRFHDLRHTHATMALRANIHPKVVSERLGHASISITLDTYSHAIPAMQEDAAETVAAMLSDRDAV